MAFFKLDKSLVQIVSKLGRVFRKYGKTLRKSSEVYARHLEMPHVRDAECFFAKIFFFFCAKSDDSLLLAFSTFIAY